jgi:glycosyltransferase involved in cell wall biosynthesis
MEDNVIVSIHCIVFNQAPYLRQCLEGFIMQKTNFKFEAIVHDDASTDGSADIIREYAAKYPHIIKPILEIDNQWSKHDESLNKIMLKFCTGKYMAYCEGDDYWTDPNKLQRQVDFLDEHLEYVATTENAEFFDMKTNRRFPFSNEPERDISIEELILKRRFATASVLVRREIIAQDYYDLKYHYDTITWCYFRTKGKIKYFPIVSSVYRRGAGITETTDPYQWALIVEKWDIELQNKFGKYVNKENFIRNIIANQFINSSYVCLLRRNHHFISCIKRAFHYNPFLVIKLCPKLWMEFQIKRIIRRK